MDFNSIFNWVFIVLYVGAIFLFCIFMTKVAIEKRRGQGGA